jgi:hypothetical protein
MPCSSATGRYARVVPSARSRCRPMGRRKCGRYYNKTLQKLQNNINTLLLQTVYRKFQNNIRRYCRKLKPDPKFSENFANYLKSQLSRTQDPAQRQSCPDPRGVKISLVQHVVVELALAPGRRATGQAVNVDGLWHQRAILNHLSHALGHPRMRPPGRQHVLAK